MEYSIVAAALFGAIMMVGLAFVLYGFAWLIGEAFGWYHL